MIHGPWCWWDSDPFSGDFRYASDETFPAIPSCRRAVEETVQLLQKSGHTIVEFEPPQLKELQYRYFHHSLGDGGSNALSWLEGDLIDQSIEMNMLVWRLPTWFKDTVLRLERFFV